MGNESGPDKTAAVEL